MFLRDLAKSTSSSCSSTTAAGQPVQHKPQPLHLSTPPTAISNAWGLLAAHLFVINSLLHDRFTLACQLPNPTRSSSSSKAPCQAVQHSRQPQPHPTALMGSQGGCLEQQGSKH